MDTNSIITAMYNESGITKVGKTRQWAKGQILSLVGFPNLPAAFEMYFQNADGTPINAQGQIGTDGQVSIPDAFFANGSNINAWMWLPTSGDTGKYIYKFVLPVERCARPNNYTYSQEQETIVDQAIAALNEADTKMAHKSDIATTFSSETSYSTGEYVYYNGILYRYTADHAAGAWIGTDATAAVIGDVLTSLREASNETDSVADMVTGVRAYSDWQDGRIMTNTDPIVPTTVLTDGWFHQIIPCTAGDVFHIKVGSAISSARPWTFCDSSWNVLSQAGSNVYDADFTAPENSAYLICNARYSQGVVYGGTSRIADVESILANSTYLKQGRLNNYPVDIDGVTEIGTYAVFEDPNGNRYTHCPTSKGGQLIVVNSYGNFAAQMIIDATGKLFVRYYLTSWTEWAEFASTTAVCADREEAERWGNLLGIFQTIGVVGDSLASGQGRINDLNHYHDFYEYSWPQQMKRQLGNEIYNFTESSLSTRTWLTDADHGWPLASDGSHDCQCYIIGLGANDVALVENDPTYLGSAADINEDYTQNPDTFYGNYAKIICLLKTIDPRVKIFTLTNPAYGTASVRDQINTAIAYMETVFDNVYNVTLDTDLYTSGFVNANKIKSHYTPAAYLYFANDLLRRLSKVIYENPSDFYFANLIGTDYITPTIT